MDIADEGFLEIIHSFNSNNVQFMLVGGFAVNYYGYNRTTADFDLWVKPDNTNKTLIVESMLNLGYSQEELKDLASQDFSSPVTFQIGGNTFYVDVMTHISGVNFDEAYEISISETINLNVPLRIIHRNHLIVNKLLSGRTKDKLDVEALQKIQQNNPDKA